LPLPEYFRGKKRRTGAVDRGTTQAEISRDFVPAKPRILTVPAVRLADDPEQTRHCAPLRGISRTASNSALGTRKKPSFNTESTIALHLYRLRRRRNAPAPHGEVVRDPARILCTVDLLRPRNARILRKEERFADRSAGWIVRATRPEALWSRHAASFFRVFVFPSPLRPLSANRRFQREIVGAVVLSCRSITSTTGQKQSLNRRALKTFRAGAAPDARSGELLCCCK